jgi:hypothetical protein
MPMFDAGGNKNTRWNHIRKRKGAKQNQTPATQIMRSLTNKKCITKLDIARDVDLTSHIPTWKHNMNPVRQYLLDAFFFQSSNLQIRKTDAKGVSCGNLLNAIRHVHLCSAPNVARKWGSDNFAGNASKISVLYAEHLLKNKCTRTCQ